MAAPMATWLSSSALLKSACVQVVYTKETKKTKNLVLRPRTPAGESGAAVAPERLVPLSVHWQHRGAVPLAITSKVTVVPAATGQAGLPALSDSYKTRCRRRPVWRLNFSRNSESEAR